MERKEFWSRQTKSAPNFGESFEDVSSSIASRLVESYGTSPIMFPPAEAPFNNLPSLESVIAGNLTDVERPLMSPPVSPEFKFSSSETCTAPHGPILYSTSGIMSDNSSFPAPENSMYQTIESHIAARSIDDSEGISYPDTDDYILVLEFKSQVGKAFMSDRVGWYLREKAQVKEDNRLRSGGGEQPLPTLASTHNVETSSKRTRVNRPPASQSSPVIIQAENPSRVRKNTGRGTVLVSGRKLAREDKDFDSLLDVCPPLDSIPDKGNSLKVEWKGGSIDLRSDPHRHLLHHDEIQLASTLRLDCATYLTSKRRIFLARIAASKAGKEFRKTDAQQACRIDVNKASKLWLAFDKVGWLDPKWIPGDA